MARTPVETHVARVRALLEPLRHREVETVALGDALGRVTASAVRSPMALPPFRNSQMDGFAVRAGELPASLPIVGEVAATPGEPPSLEPGTAVRIMTGAPVPAGADAIVPVEEAAVDGDLVRLPAPAVGAYVRETGSDVAAGDVVVAAGIRLAARHLAAVAAAGLATIEVLTRPRVAVVSTGSELAEPGASLAFGQIPDANGVALEAASRAAGAELVHRGRVADDPDRLAAELDAALAAGAELVLTSGGVSMGEHEVVRELLEPLGAHVDVLAMQPGGPQATGEWRGGRSSASPATRSRAS